MCAEEIITIAAYYNEVLLLQRNLTKCISYKINNSRPTVCTQYIKKPKCFEITFTLPDRKKILFHYLYQYYPAAAVV